MSSSSFLKPRIIDVQNISPVPRQADDGAVRARLRPHAGQRAAAHAAVLDAGLRGDRGQDQRRAARVLDHRRRAGGRGGPAAQPQGHRAEDAQPRGGAAHRSRNRAKAWSPPATSSRCTTWRSSIPTTSSRISPPAASSTCRSRSSRGAATSRRPPARPIAEEGRTVGSILLDASFSPVRRVSYAVEAARVEQRTDLDKLVIDIETNGAIDPEEGGALRRAHPGRAALGVCGPEGPADADRGEEGDPDRPDPAAARWTTSSSPCARPTASRPRTSTTSATSSSAPRPSSEDAEPRPQVAERDQGSPRLARAHAGHEARELAAGGAARRSGEDGRDRSSNRIALTW